MTGRRIALGGGALVLVVLALALVFRDRQADCARLLQTAELAVGSQVRQTPLGGCRIELAPSTIPALPASGDQAPLSEPAVAAQSTEVTTGSATGPKLAAEDVTIERVEAEKSPGLSRCLQTGDAAKGVSVAMGGCVHAELEAQDVRLNAAYGAVMRRLNETDRRRLRTEERAWIRERDAGCAQEATGGTIDLVDIPACRLDETIRRRLILESRLP